MRIRRSLPIILGVLLIAAALALVVVLRKHAPPEAARLLPTADAFVYFDLQWLRRASLAGDLPPVPHDPDYEAFIQGTGFQFERDLEEVAVAIHYPSSLPPPAPNHPAEARFSEVFVGKIQSEKLRQYLGKLGGSVQSYRGVDIYSVPLEGRTVRVAILGVDSVAASNHPDPQVIEGMVQRSRKLASPFGGPSLLRQHYQRVPLASLAWGIFKVQPEQNASASSPFNWSFLFSRPAVVVASIRYLRAVHFKAAAITDSEDEARHVAEQLNAFLNLFQAAQASAVTQGPDPDVKAVFDSLKVEQQGNHAILTAAIPVAFIRKILTEGPPVSLPQPQAPATPKPAPPAKKSRSEVKPH